MKYKGILSSDARGSINGVVASRNRYGTYFRAKGIPVNPRSTKQVIVRARLNQLSASWRTLTAVQQLAWITLAAQVPYSNSIGDQIYLSGQQLFVSWNLILLQASLQQNNNAPAVPPAVADPVTINLNAQATLATFQIGIGGTLTAPDRVLIEATPPISAGRAFISPSLWRFLATASAVGTQNLTVNFTSAFGTLSVGARVYARITPFNASVGLKGLPVQTSILLV